MNSSPKHIIVVGASAGGLNALTQMVRYLPTRMDAAYCFVLHLSGKAVGDFVTDRLSKVTSIPCSLVSDGDEIERDHVYIARPNHHMLVKESKFTLGSGPEENRWRPSIDVLFRSAAVAYGSNTVGIILSGLLDDGTSGMWAIKKSGGTCIVQKPDEAEYPDMPLSVMNHMSVDYVLGLQDIGVALPGILATKHEDNTKVPWEVIAESRIAEQTAIGIDDLEKLNVEKTAYACPDCGGNLWEVKGDVYPRYRCHIGHGYSQRDLALKQLEKAGETTVNYP